ncbi:MAG: hypothetical protein AAGF94_01170 [Pseudomonadota bacterium]
MKPLAGLTLSSAANDRDRLLLQGPNETILAIWSAAASPLCGALYVGIGWIGLAAV